MRCFLYFWFLAILSYAASNPGISNWQKQQVDWRVSAQRQIKAIYYPDKASLPTLENQGRRRSVELRPKAMAENESALSTMGVNTATTVYANVIDSPPINGFAPYVAVAITDERSYETYDIDAYPEDSVVGNYLTGNPESDYLIGFFDTGASAHIINAYDAAIAGIYDADLITSFSVSLTGATNDVNALVSQPLAIFTDGLEAIDANTFFVDDSNMVGQSNVAVIIGDIVESPNLPTVVGSPLAFFFTAVIENSSTVTLNFYGNDITAPNIRLYQHNSSNIPTYPNKINLELRPSTAYAVQYLPCFELLGEYCPEGDGEPKSPSVVFGSEFDVPQSLFFATRTDLAHGSRTSQQKHFMFDTGAQITVISEALAAELELLQNDPNFYVEIVDVTGTSTIADGYYIDLLEITATPAWLSFTHTPVVILDVDSPEGGILDGIIGMNLFTGMDFYIRGGGLNGQDQPYIMFDFLPTGLIGDIAPAGGDGTVNILDIAVFAQAWLANPLLPDWNARADMVSDAVINFRDFTILAQNWLQIVTD